MRLMLANLRTPDPHIFPFAARLTSFQLRGPRLGVLAFGLTPTDVNDRIPLLTRSTVEGGEMLG